jgi:hypothetical protein
MKIAGFEVLALAFATPSTRGLPGVAFRDVQ